MIDIMITNYLKQTRNLHPLIIFIELQTNLVSINN